MQHRLNKYIALSGICSRRDADELIISGQVQVNGKTVTELGFKITDKDKVFINKRLIRPKKYEYYRFYKPPGYITTSDDEKGRKTIYDVIPKELHNLKPVGRLDKESSGLIILTNDGDLINALTHPSIKVPKVYIVSVDGKINAEHVRKMASGIEIEPEKKAYAEVTVIEATSNSTMMQITLYQGMNRQIRKMFEYLGFNVKSLKRVQHATITIGDLKRGELKPIKPLQIRELKKYLEKLTKNG